MALDKRSVRTETDGDVVVKLSNGTLTANILNTGSNDSLAVAIVDGSGNQITSFGGGTQYATNAAYADGNTGTLALVVRDDALSTLTEADGDYSALRVDSTGALWVNLTDTTFAVTATNLDIRDLTNTDVVTAELSAVDNAVLDAIAASVAAIDTDTTTIIGHVDGIEALLGTIDGDTSTLAAVDYATQTTLAAINAKLVSGTDIGDVTINNTASNPVPVYMVDAAEVGVTAYAGTETSSALAAQASETICDTALQANKTGRLQQVSVSSEVPFKAVIQKSDETSTVTTIHTLYGEAGSTVPWTPKNTSHALFEVASDGTPTAKFQIVVTNNNASGIGASGTISGILEWDEE